MSGVRAGTAVEASPYVPNYASGLSLLTGSGTGCESRLWQSGWWSRIMLAIISGEEHSFIQHRRDSYVFCDLC